MTSTVEESTPQVEAPAQKPYASDKPSKVDLSTYDDATLSRLWLKVAEAEPRVWKLYEDLQKFSPPTNAEIEDILSNSEDPQLQALVDAITEAEKALTLAKQEARAFVLSGIETLPEEELNSTQEEFKGEAQKLKHLLSLIHDLADAMGFSDAVEALKDYKIPTLRGISGGAPASRGTGDGPARPQVKEIRVTKQGRELKNFTTDKAKLSYAATYMKGDTSELLGLWLTAASAEKWQDVKEPVTFAYGDYEVTVTPKA